jgi:1-acyl-sn-glycerol-3-phosphate acyltransferase
MLGFLPAPIIGVIGLLLYLLNLIFWVIILFASAAVHYLMPTVNLRRKTYQLMQALPAHWIDGHNWIIRWTTQIDWQIEGLEGLSANNWYFLIANHQSWADIVILEKVFNRRIPTLKFFLKKALIWLPFAGQACWLLDFPFMERPNKSYLKKHPELKGKDSQAVRIACEKFKQSPTTIINFLEGTRWDTLKQKSQASTYSHLLRPKSTGLATALSALEGYVKYLIDVTIIYSDSENIAWDFLCGRIKKITVKIRVLPVPEPFLKNFIEDRNARAKFQQWINQIWHEKNQLIKLPSYE